MIWPLGLYLAIAIFLPAAIIVLSYILGQRHSGRAMGEPYESGIKPSESARVRYDIKYYHIAMFFLVFDIESIFIYTWAVSLKYLGWTAYFSMVFFVAVLGAALVYIYKNGAFEWGRKKTS
jgi:NADH-quinone oxidoreductase subunit A